MFLYRWFGSGVLKNTKGVGYTLIRCLSSKSELSQPPTGRQVSQYGIKKSLFSGQVPALDREGRRKARVYFEVKKPTVPNLLGYHRPSFSSMR